LARTNLSVDRDIFEEFSAEAERRNMTLYAFANESLSVVTKIAAKGGDPNEVYRLWKVLSVLKEAEVITLPSEFVEEMVTQLYKIDKKRLLLRFSELGSSLVAILRIAADDVEGLAMLARGYLFLVPIKHFDIRNVRNGTIEVDVVGAGKGIETTECSSEFLKSILNGYGYVVLREEIHAGVIRLWAESKSKKNMLTEVAPQQM
jgi:hypothetical protein